MFVLNIDSSVMREKTLNSVISLFAIITAYKPDRGISLFRNLLEVYLNSQFSDETTKSGLDTFEKEILNYQQRLRNLLNDSSFFLLEEIEAHCYILSRELTMAQRILILVYLLDFETARPDSEQLDSDADLILLISNGLKINNGDYQDCLAFVSESFDKISNDNDLLVVTDELPFTVSGVCQHTFPGLPTQLYFLRLNKMNTVLFRIGGSAHLVLSGKHLFRHRTYILDKGGVIQIGQGQALSYNQIERFFLNLSNQHSFVLQAKDLEFKFSNGTYGVHKVAFQVQSGELMAIMGGSGSGKTTLMNLLIGLYKPLAGSVTLNGADVFRNNKMVKGHMGYVPQDDALYENLTAFQNLFFIAHFSLNNLSAQEKTNRVNRLLKDLGLWRIRNLRVGSPNDKIISGGQRKRLNIALELIREPGILFLDEPTSGLSSADTVSIMKLLRTMANNGRLIIINIHQPSSSVFKMFDKLLFIDQGGYPVYFGASLQVVGYLKNKLRFVDAHQNECPHCGNLDPDDVFNLTQIEKVHTTIKQKEKRQMTAPNWHKHFLSGLSSIREKVDAVGLKPANLQIPNVLTQFWFYFYRNLLLRIKDVQYVLLSLFLTPLLALILSVFTKQINSSIGQYQYYENENIPAFVFMSVIVALFVGVMTSATEIIKDRAALKREAFLNLSYGSYYLSKVVFLTILSGIQMLSYTWISVLILKIPLGTGFLFYILWASAVFANVLGLLLSSFFKTMATVYLSIPFLLIPQILFAGAVLDFNKINPLFSSEKYVPVFADVMVSRWAFEAIMVAQFLDNPYSNHFYQTDKKMAEFTYYRSFLIPEIEEDFYGDSYSSSHFLTPDSITYLRVIDGINQLESFKHFQGSKDSLNSFDMLAYLQEMKKIVSSSADSMQLIKDELIGSMGSSLYNQLKETSTNKELNEILTDEKNFNKILKTSDSYIRKLYPVYFDSDNEWGRAQFYAPGKSFMGYTISTPVFNLIVIMLFSFVLTILGLIKPVRIK